MNVQFYLLIYLISYPIILLIHQLLYSRSVPYYLFVLPFIYLFIYFCYSLVDLYLCCRILNLMFNILLMNDSMRFFTKPRPSAWLPLPSVKRMAGTVGSNRTLSYGLKPTSIPLKFLFFLSNLIFFWSESYFS